MVSIADGANNQVSPLSSWGRIRRSRSWPRRYRDGRIAISRYIWAQAARENPATRSEKLPGPSEGKRIKGKEEVDLAPYRRVLGRHAEKLKCISELEAVDGEGHYDQR